MKKLTLPSFSKLMDNNRFLTVISVLSAILAWFFVTTTIDPNQAITVDDIPLHVDVAGTSAAANHLNIIEGADQKISIRVEGKRYRIATLTPDDFVVSVNMADVNEAGEYNLPLTVSKRNINDLDFTIVSYPESVLLSFDRVKSQEFEIEAIADGIIAAEGYIKERPTVSPSTLVLSGAEREIDQIDRVVVEYLGSSTLMDTVTIAGKLTFYDANGKAVTPEHVTYNKTEFKLTIPIYMQKELPLEVSFINTNGLDTSRFTYALSTEKVNIAGPKEIISKRNAIEIGPIDLSKLDMDSKFAFKLDLNAGELDIDDIGEVTVDIDMDSFSTKTLSMSKDNILFRNVPADYNVILRSSAINDIKLVGDSDDIEKLSAAELVATIDLTNVEVGTSRVRATIYATGEKFVWAVGEYYVTVQATEK